jgi:hypothetical protein
MQFAVTLKINPPRARLAIARAAIWALAIAATYRIIPIDEAFKAADAISARVVRGLKFEAV